MELDDFIKRTLLGIHKGVHEANAELAAQEGKTLGKDATAAFVMQPNNRESKQGYVEFDIAVTVGSTTSKSGGAGIKVYAVNLGGEKGSDSSHEQVSRIRFHVLPFRFIA